MSIKAEYVWLCLLVVVCAAGTSLAQSPYQVISVEDGGTVKGSVQLRCNAGHVWMNGEMMVASHPYCAITDADGNFELTQVPPGDYEIVAWHEGWRIVGESPLYDVMTQTRVKRPVFSDPIIWSKQVTVPTHDTAEVNFTLEQRNPQMPAGH